MHKELSVDLEFTVKDVGNTEVNVYLMSDSYNGCDQEYKIIFHVNQDEETMP